MEVLNVNCFFEQPVPLVVLVELAVVVCHAEFEVVRCEVDLGVDGDNLSAVLQSELLSDNVEVWKCAALESLFCFQVKQVVLFGCIATQEHDLIDVPVDRNRADSRSQELFLFSSDDWLLVLLDDFGNTIVNFNNHGFGYVY
jgi:hypothetical protein